MNETEHAAAIAAELTGLTGDEWTSGVNEVGGVIISGPDGLVWGVTGYRGKWSLWACLWTDQIPGADRVSATIWENKINPWRRRTEVTFDTTSNRPRYAAQQIHKRLDEHRGAVADLAARVDTWLQKHQDMQARVEKLKEVGGHTVTATNIDGDIKVHIRTRDTDINIHAAQPTPIGWAFNGNRVTETVMIALAAAAKAHDEGAQ